MYSLLVWLTHFALIQCSNNMVIEETTRKFEISTLSYSPLNEELTIEIPIHYIYETGKDIHLAVTFLLDEDEARTMEAVESVCGEYNFSEQFCTILYEKVSSKIAIFISKLRLDEQMKTNSSYLVFQQTALSPVKGETQFQLEIDQPLPYQILEKNQRIKLNIGGYCYKEGWLVVNVQTDTFRHCIGGVDIFREMHNLSGIPDSSVRSIYASHILEV